RASKFPKTARICSNRNATSRPRFSPASVTTAKCAEFKLTHPSWVGGFFSDAEPGRAKMNNRNAIAIRGRNTDAGRQQRVCTRKCYHFFSPRDQATREGSGLAVTKNSHRR